MLSGTVKPGQFHGRCLALVERYLRKTVRERVTAGGDIEIALDREDARRQVQALLRDGRAGPIRGL